MLLPVSGVACASPGRTQPVTNSCGGHHWASWCMLWASLTGRGDSRGQPACFDCPRMQRGDSGAALLPASLLRGAPRVSACVLEMPVSVRPVLALHAEWWCH